jgi:hypothetical protein
MEFYNNLHNKKIIFAVSQFNKIKIMIIYHKKYKKWICKIHNNNNRYKKAIEAPQEKINKQIIAYDTESSYVKGPDWIKNGKSGGLQYVNK